MDVKKAEKKGVPSKTEKKIVSSSVKDPLSAMLDPLSASLEGSDPLSQMAISSQSVTSAGKKSSFKVIYNTVLKTKCLIGLFLYDRKKP